MESSPSDDDNSTKLTRLAVEHHLLEQKKKKNKGDDDDDEEVLISKLLSQLESVKKDGRYKNYEPEVETKEPSSADIKAKPNEAAGEGSGTKEMGMEEIIKELKQVKRQNSITHWLLTIVIALTAAWQFSEVTLLMKVKNKVTYPFKSIGNLITGAQDALKHLDGTEVDPSRKRNHNESPSLQMPELPLPMLGANAEEKPTHKSQNH